MTGSTHALGGVGALWLLEAIPGTLTAQNIGILAAVAAVGALLPDLDASRSKIRSFSVGPLRPLEPLADLIHQAWGHRGLLHSALGLAFCAALLAIPLAPWWGGEPSTALLLGYGSHLLLDSLTPSGIPWLPLRGADGRWSLRHRFHLLPWPFRITTGSLAEDVLQAILAGTDLLLLLRHLAVSG